MSGKQKPAPHAVLCRNCKHFELERVLSKDGRVMRDRTARCLFPTDTIKVPKAALPKHIHTVRMCADDGDGCATFEQREAERANG